jgi:hypothetical protein
MLHPFPEEDLLARPLAGWKSRVFPNETLQFHQWMMRREMFRWWDRSFRLALKGMPGLVERALQRVNREPSYRKIFVLTRESEEARA